uniref:Small subunit processome component 20 homolog n=1 Tax=Eptatretus burgeri TaxID=7764 RepID=A0A8C4WNT3_EPTBU
MLPLVNVDPEADFFENIRHIQGHRRARALTRLARRLDEGSISISPAILQGYFIPFATRMLQDDGTIKNENILVNAGIELLRAICRQLPWKQYLPILRRYQHGLHNKKISLRLSIRLLVAVLDAFHFDHETLLREEEEEEEERMKSSAEAKTKDDLTEVIMNEEEGAPTAEEERKDAKSNDCSAEQTKAGENPKRLQKQAVVGRPEGQVVPKGSSSVQSGRRASEKIRHTVERVILPRLLMSISAKSKADSQHKMVKSFGPDDELVARIPLALSAVHLLQALPPFAREQQLPSILLKVCLLLRNRLKRVREIARTTLSKILQVLGPPYLFYVLREMSSTLSKGYQIHVLMFTLHALLNGLQSRLQHGDLDTCAKLIQETCNRELFGDIAETKRVPGILRRVVEARACRSYAVYQTLSRFLSCGLLTKLISPLKEVVDRTGKYETIAKVQEVLRRIVQGLMENTAIGFEDLILLSHSLVTQSLPFLSGNRKGRKKETNQEKPKSCLLLPPSPKRGGEIAVVGVKTNSHVMVEFGLQVLKCSLRKRKLMGSNKKALEMLDPFVPLLCNCLESQHIPVITLSLCCLECVLSFEIPALHESSVALTRHLFSLLKNYASTGAGVGDNFVLVLSCFKTITAMLRNRKCDDLSENQLQVLLGYVEEDVHDNSRQATAFSLLKAILDRKLMVPEMNDVMKKVAQMSISSHVEPIRVQCRKVYLTFIMEYPLERKLQEHLEFIISQLEYEHDTGRESALEILMTMFKLFPAALVEKHSGVFFLPLALMLGKESGLQTRKMASLAIRGLLDRLRPNCRVPLFKLTSSWLHSPKVTLRRLAVQVCGLFADVERLHFEKNLPGLLPVLHSELEAPFDSQMNESMERASDQLLFSVLSLLSKLLHICPVLTSTSRHKIMINIWESVQRHLLHPQAWVRLQAGQLFGQLFESWTPEKLVHGTGMLRPNFLVANLQGKMEELARAFSLQLKSPLLSEELSVQIRQNILFVMKVCHHLDSALEFQENEDEGEKCKKEEDVEELKEDGVAQGKQKCLAWILGRLSLITRSEAACTPHIMFKRTCVFHVFSNLAISLGKESTIPFLRTMLQPLFRELGNTYAEQDATLKTLALETIDKLKDVVGREEFSLAYNAVHQRVKELRVRRKMLQAQQAVSNPDIAARRKMKKHLNKIQSKKRKAEMHWVGCRRKRRRN